MLARRSWWRRVLVSGSAASALSGIVACELSRRENRAPLAAINAVSHWLYGPVAYGADRPSLRHTLPGIIVHHASSLFWGALYQSLLHSVVDRRVGGEDRPARRGHPTEADRWASAAVVTAIAALTDLRLVPPRLSPGFEHRLSRSGVSLVYLGFAGGLALGSAERPGGSSSPFNV